MFKLEGYIEDKHVTKVMYALSGLIHDMKMVPVVNAKKTANGIGAKTNGSVPELFLDWAKQHKLSTVNASSMRQFQHDIGRSAAAYSNTLKIIVEAGLLKRRGKGQMTTYDVVRK